tara:strand:- start:3133 stop:3798 length:666 start_codon:yes stop_codon:yes gene_type:complete
MKTPYGQLTYPMGEIRPRHTDLGTMGPLRMVGSQPQLIGEDLPDLDSSELSGYGVHFTHGDNFGGDAYWGQVLKDTRKKNIPSAVADIVDALRLSGKKAGVDTAAAISIQTGVPLTEAALEVIATRKMGVTELQSRLATNRAAFARAKAQGKRNKARRLKVRVLALEKRLSEVSQGQMQAVSDLPGVAGEASRIPPWVTYAGLGLGALSVIIAISGKRKGK